MDLSRRFASVAVVICVYWAVSFASDSSAVSSEPVGTSDSAAASTGVLIVKTIPSGATVTIDGVNMGPAPVRVDSIPTGKRRVQLEIAGYLGKVAGVVVAGGSEQEVQFKMVQAAGLTVVSTPTGATVTVDSVAVGVSPVTLSGLRPGAHTVSVELSGRASVSRKVDVAEGAMDTVVIALETRTAPSAGAEAASDRARDAEGRPGRAKQRRGAVIGSIAAFGAFALAILIADGAGGE